MVVWPANVLCVHFPSTDKTFALPHPSSYQDLVVYCTSIFGLADSLEGADNEIYFESLDFGLGKPVELLPEVWGVFEGQRFLTCLQVRVRKVGTGPQSLFEMSTSLQSAGSSALLPSPESSSSSGMSDSNGCKSTVVHRTQNTPESSTPRRRGRRKSGRQGRTAREQDEIDSRKEQSRTSCNMRGDTDHVRPIRVRPDQRECEVEISPQPPTTSQEPEESTRSRIQICVTIRYDTSEASFNVTKRESVRSVINRACKRFKVDSTRAKLLRVIEYDGSTSNQKWVCQPEDDFGNLGLKKDDVLILAMYEPSA